MTEQAAGMRRPLAPIGEGFRSRTYRSADGLVVRVPKNAVAMAMQRQLEAVLEALAPHITALPIPGPVCAMTPSAEFPFGGLTYPLLPGRPLRPADITPRNRAALARQLATFLHELHALDPGLFAGIALARFPPPPDELRHIWGRCAAYLQAVLAAPRYARVARWYGVALRGLAADPPRTGVIHGDLWHENLLFDGHRLVGVLDFESVGIGPPVADLMTLGYLGDDFLAAVVGAYRRRASAFAYDAGLARRLLGIRELEGLAYGLATDDVDPDTVGKIVAVVCV